MPLAEPPIVDLDHCSIAGTLAVIGEKWTLLVLRDAFMGVRRFEDLQRRTGAPREVLTRRLARLVDAGLLRRVPYQEPGRRTRDEYRLTESGIALYPILVAITHWGDEHLPHPDGIAMEMRHRDCGEPIALELRCAAGHHLDSAREVTPVPGPYLRSLAG
jgi:DNA-binding HxlR family transcriptional regulator